jgi:transposase
MAHPRAKLTQFGRVLLVQRVLEFGWSVPRAAESVGISRATAYKWLRRFREEGLAGLDDRPSRPRTSPRVLAEADVQRILKVRRRWRKGPHQIGPLLGVPPSTVYKVLRRHGLSRLRDNDRSTGVPVRYVKDYPGEMVHIDVKKLGRIPDGGGHRMLGPRARDRRGGGYEYVHVAVDDFSRVGFAEVYPDQTGSSAASFLLDTAAFFADRGVRIERVMTDRALSFVRSHDFQYALEQIGAKHRPTRRRRPQTNGKAERFIQTMLDE